MKKLKNWDNKTWLSSKKYISEFNKFLNSKIKFNKSTKILDIGCGRANIISALQKKYKFKEKPIGLDIIKNKGIKKDIIFKKIDGYDHLKCKSKKYDLIWIDGAHGYPFITADIINSLKILNHSGIILCDDIFIEIGTREKKVEDHIKIFSELGNNFGRTRK